MTTAPRLTLLARSAAARFAKPVLHRRIGVRMLLWLPLLLQWRLGSRRRASTTRNRLTVLLHATGASRTLFAVASRPQAHGGRRIGPGRAYFLEASLVLAAYMLRKDAIEWRRQAERNRGEQNTRRLAKRKRPRLHYKFKALSSVRFSWTPPVMLLLRLQSVTKQQLKKATITVLDGADKGKVIAVLFNPSEYSFERANTYKVTPLPGLGTPLIQFINGESDQLSMELFLDDYTDPEGPTSRERKEQQPVMARLKDLSHLLEIDSKIHAPPSVRFDWGPMHFTAVIEKLGRKVTMFHPDGTPARATLSVNFREYRTLQRQLQQPRRESADASKRRVVIGGDALWLIAFREYDDPREWVRIAEENDLDDPRDIKPGDWLLLPPMENPNGTGSSF